MLLRKKKPDIFERLEQEASDELRLLDELGPAHFGTEHLLELHLAVCNKITLQKRLQKIALSIAFAGIGWLALGMASWMLGYIIPGAIAFGLSTLSILAFGALLLYTFRRFNTKGYLEHTRLSIEDELRKRRGLQRSWRDF